MGKMFYSAAKQAQFLLYGKGRPGVIKGITMALGDKQQEVMIPITDLSRPTALDYDISTQHIYYSDVQRFIIERQKVDGSSREVVMDKGIHFVTFQYFFNMYFFIFFILIMFVATDLVRRLE